MHIHQDRRRPLGVEHVHARAQQLFDRRLQGQIKRQPQRRARLRRIAQPRIQRLLDPRRADHLGRLYALGAETRPAQHMRGQRAIGVKPHLARPEQQTRIADLMHLLHLLGAHHLADPHEGPPVRQPPLQRRRVKFGEDRGKFLRHPNRIDHVLGLRVKRIGLHVRGQYPPVAVGDIGPLRRYLGPRCGTARLHRLGGGKQPHPRPDGAKGRKETKAKEQKPPLRPQPAAVPDRLMPQAQVLALAAVGVLALLAGGKDAGKRTQRCADHGTSLPSTMLSEGSISPDTSTGSVIAGNPSSPTASGAGEGTG